MLARPLVVEGVSVLLYFFLQSPFCLPVPDQYYLLVSHVLQLRFSGNQTTLVFDVTEHEMKTLQIEVNGDDPVPII